MTNDGLAHISVRLDSDDPINRGFIEVLRKICVEEDTVYKFPRGLGFFEDSGHAVNKWIESGPFIALEAPPPPTFYPSGCIPQSMTHMSSEKSQL